MKPEAAAAAAAHVAAAVAPNEVACRVGSRRHDLLLLLLPRIRCDAATTAAAEDWGMVGITEGDAAVFDLKGTMLRVGLTNCCWCGRARGCCGSGSELQVGAAPTAADKASICWRPVGLYRHVSPTTWA